MGSLVKALFGGESTTAIEAQEGSNEMLRNFLARSQDLARADIRKTLPSQLNAMNAGGEAAFDIYGQTMPLQADAFLGGNVAAQQAILAGMPMFENAIRGGRIDYSAMKPYEGTYDPSFTQQSLPAAVTNPAYLAEAQTIDPRNAYVSPEYQNDQINFMKMGAGGSAGGSAAGLGGTYIDDLLLAEMMDGRRP